MQETFGLKRKLIDAIMEGKIEWKNKDRICVPLFQLPPFIQMSRWVVSISLRYFSPLRLLMTGFIFVQHLRF